MIYIVSKLFTYIFLPPGIFIIVLFLAFLFSKRLKALFLLSAIFLYLVSITPVKDFLIKPLENINIDNSTANVVVVLGGGTNARGVIELNAESFERLIFGLMLSRKYNIPLIFSGGGLKFNESKSARHDLNELCSLFNCNVKVYFDNRSLNTYQNAKFTNELFNRFNFSKDIFLVTSAYHMKRAEILFKHFGFSVHPRPVGFLYEGKYNFFDYLPKMKNLYESYKALHEYFGILSLKILHGL